ncbi:tumor suppressor ARF-like [Camelus ferus]|uniref:Tumor suppressor ARF-like n=2 Tax=Camelus TaxID=9836 RepID=A0A8B8SUM0_CAMFR|nr:tumor suppressor ARF-like [Camelus dromedarius]XP_032333489.1 tumor suppressor ARF-like [Camelus ferus]
MGGGRCAVFSVRLGGRAPNCLPLKPKGGTAPAELRGGKNMVRRLLVTVRIRRACGPPRVRAFVVHIARPAGEWAAPGVRAAAALVLMLVRSQRRAQQPHPRPGRKGLENPGHNRPLDDFV